MTSDGFEPLPHTADVVLLQLILHLPPVACFSFPDLLSEFSLDSFQLFLVSRFKNPLLLFKESLYIRVHPRFIVGKTLYSPGGYSILHTEINVVRNTVC